MKYLQRYLLFLFALVMCVSLFSTIVHAEDITVAPYRIIASNVYTINGQWKYAPTHIFTPNNGIQETAEYDWNLSYSEISTSPHKVNFITYLTVIPQDESILAEGNIKTTVKLENIYWSYLTTCEMQTYIYYYGFNEVDCIVKYVDGTTTTINGTYELRANEFNYDLKATFTPTQDVVEVKFYLRKTLAGVNNFEQFQYSDNITVRAFAGEYDGDNKYKFIVQQPSEEATLLEGILGKLTSGFSELGEKITNVFNSIIELPTKLWEKISDGLKGLFVPSEESMTAYKDKWDELLASRFGAVYQVVNIMTDSWDGIMQADETDTINFPSATLNFSGSSFSFGGYDVKIVPDGFGVLVTAIKSIVAIVCTVAFVNGMRKRYDEIMGVEQ